VPRDPAAGGVAAIEIIDSPEATRATQIGNPLLIEAENRASEAHLSDPTGILRFARSASLPPGPSWLLAPGS
jgi:hypothetical protein